MNHHQGEHVAGQSVVSRRVYVMKAGPVLDEQNEWRNALVDCNTPETDEWIVHKVIKINGMKVSYGK